MIQPNELRIGNYLKYLGTIIQINGIAIDSDKKGLCYINTIKGIHTNTSFKPIELIE